MIIFDIASIVAGFLQVRDIEKLMRTCKQIQTDNLVRKVCMDKLAEPYTMRWYPVHAEGVVINTRDGYQLPRTFRIHSQLGYRSANLLMGPPEYEEINSSFIHIRYGSVLFSFHTPQEPFMEDGHASEVPVKSLVDDAFLSTVVGISFRELRIIAHTMRLVLVVARRPTLTLRLESRSFDFI
jgi:hypothetical protein